MLSAAALAMAIGGGTAARAAAAPSGKDCLRRLERALMGADLAPAASCLDADVSWRDSDGAAKGRRAALARLKALGRERLSIERGEASVSLAGLTILPSLGGQAHGRRLVALEGSAPWRAVIVYWAQRGWPDRLDAGAPASSTAELDAVLGAFNTRFSTGNVAGWLASWRRDATFLSFAGPLQGQDDLAEFFDHQARRYVRPRIEARRRLAGPTPDSFVVEGDLRGLCRDGGRAFDMPMLLLLELSEGRVRLAYEAFAAKEDGCGPF